MALPRRSTKPEDERNREAQMKSPIRIDAVPSNFKAPLCGVLDAHHPIALTDIDRDAFASAERTRSALLVLIEDPGDPSAIEILWQENAEAIEREMLFHVDSPSNQKHIRHILSAVAAQSKYFCDEFDDPKEWVARCAKLEARRFALEVKTSS